MIKRICLLPLLLSLSSIALAQATGEVRSLVPGQPVEREIAGGESQTYQISLAAGQFMRVVVDQRGIDVRPSAALRAAQVEMWKQKQWQSPYYWAAFTMQGEGR